MKILFAILGSIVAIVGLVFLFSLPGWFAYCYVAPLYGLPVLTFWQFFVSGIAARCLIGTGTSTASGNKSD